MPLPARCLLCQCWGWAPVCAPCRARFAPGAGLRPRCGGCGTPLAVGVVRCVDCLRQAPPQAATVVAVDYQHPWDRVLLGFKHGQRPDCAAALADLLARAVQDAEPGAVDWVVPVPLSRRRLALRGYNQAWELARRVARHLHRPARADLLQRWVDLPQQAQQDRDQRLQRLRGVFGIPPAGRAALAGRRVALVDDVYTTGATAAEAVRTLYGAGAAEVIVWAVARTPPPQDAAS